MLLLPLLAAVLIMRESSLALLSIRLRERCNATDLSEKCLLFTKSLYGIRRISVHLERGDELGKPK